MESEGRYGVEAGLVGWWRLFDSNEGVNDIVGTNDGTINGGASYGSSGGRRYLALDGVNDYVSVPDNSAFDLESGSYSIAFHIYIDVIASENYALSLNADTTGITGLMSFEYTPTNLYVGLYDGGYKWANYITSPPTGTWFHWAGVKDGSTLRQYYGASEVATVAVGTPTSYGTGLYFGRRHETGSPWYCDANVNDLRIYNRALSAAEVARLARIY